MDWTAWEHDGMDDRCVSQFGVLLWSRGAALNVPPVVQGSKVLAANVFPVVDRSKPRMSVVRWRPLTRRSNANQTRLLDFTTRSCHTQHLSGSEPVHTHFSPSQDWEIILLQCYQRSTWTLPISIVCGERSKAITMFHASSLALLALGLFSLDRWVSVSRDR